jgi:hypothetical protein
MLSFAPAEAWQPRIVDTFERTSNTEVSALSEKIKSEWSSSPSEYLAMLDSFDWLGRSLSRLVSVPNNWNMYGAPAPSAASIEIARRVLESLQVESLLPSRVLPSAEGGIAFIFLSNTDNRAVIESLNSDEAFILLYDRAGNSKTLDWSESWPTKRNLLRVLRDHLRGTPLATS